MFKGFPYILALIALVLVACSKDDGDLPTNPYDSIDYGDGSATDTLDANSITAIHRDIIMPRCATPGCHDGSFEPDFRTVMSTYSTLVFHPIIKNNADGDYQYRVIPYDADNSVLIKRLTVQSFANVDDRMPQDNIGTGLPQASIDRIEAWVNNGAKDPWGNSAVLPNTEPFWQWFWMIDARNWPNIFINPTVLTTPSNQYGGEWYGATIVDTSQSIFISITPQDDSTAVADLQNVRLLFSLDQDDFSNPVATKSTVYYPASGDNLAGYYSLFDIDAAFPTDTTIYMRFYMNDGDHQEDTYYPKSDSYWYYKSVWSIRVVKGSHP